MPPTVFIFAVLVGLLLCFSARWRRWGLALGLVSALSLYAFSTPLVATLLLRQLENQVPPTARDPATAQAIVVLSGTIHHGDGKDVPDEVGSLTLERLQRGAAAARKYGLPIIVSGGAIGDSPATLADLMAQSLQGDFGVPVKWREEESQTTFENAHFVAAIFKAENIHTVILVTQPWHMPRAIWAFQHEGLDPIPLPTARTYLRTPIDAAMVLPQSASLADSFYALHEMIGLVYYKWRFG
jgi:uncharacterized SAM-binding protein YcdF (DUF218 family)